MAVWVMFGLRTLIRLSACTTSGQFWQVSEKKVSKWCSPSSSSIWRDQLGRRGRGVAADLEQGEHERGELVAERDAGELHGHVGADALDREGGATGVVVGPADGDLVGERGDLVEQLGELGGLRAVVERG